MHTIFSADASNPDHTWQADLLGYSYRKARQPGPLTRLLAAPREGTEYPPDPFFDGETFPTAQWCPHPVTGDFYHPYNKPASILQWLQTPSASDETDILIVDPDFVFLRPVEGRVSPGDPLGSYATFMNLPKYDPLVSKFCSHPDRIQPLGVPILIDKRDLADVAPLWLSKTEEIRGDPQSRDIAEWIAEMWGFCIASAELGLVYRMTDQLAQYNIDDYSNRPMVHYAYTASSKDNAWKWDKVDYIPWERVPYPADSPRGSIAFLNVLNEYASLLTNARSLPCMTGYYATG